MKLFWISKIKYTINLWFLCKTTYPFARGFLDNGRIALSIRIRFWSILYSSFTRFNVESELAQIVGIDFQFGIALRWLETRIPLHCFTKLILNNYFRLTGNPLNSLRNKETDILLYSFSFPLFGFKFFE